MTDNDKKQISILINKAIAKNAKPIFYKKIKDLHNKVLRRFWREAQVHNVWGHDQPILYPVGSGGGTRLFYTKGAGSVLMYEYPPALRTIRVNEKFYRLSFPYVIFTISFISGQFSKLTVTFSQQPLTDLGQKPLCSPLNNISQDFSVCLGSSSPKSEMLKKDILTQSVEIMNYFWTSGFTESLENMNQVGSHEPRLSSYDRWQDESASNSSFIMKANLIASQVYPTYRHVFAESAMPKSETLADQVYGPIIDETLEEITGIIGSESLESISNDDLQQIIEILNKSGK